MTNTPDNRNLGRDERGAIAVWTALFLTVLAAGGGAALDLGRAYDVHARLANAVDAAGLAMGAAPPGTSATALRTIGQHYLDQNFSRNGTDGAPVALVATFSSDMNTIGLSAAVKVTTGLAQAIGVETIPVAVSSEVRRLSKALEVALVLDNTGSMWTNNNIQAVRDSATLLVNTLFGSNTVNPNLKIGLVPYAVAVNISPIANQVVATFTHPLDTARDTANWKGCVIERAPPYDSQDASTGIGGLWTQYWWPSSLDNLWNAAVYDTKGKLTKAADINNDNASLSNGVHGPNIGCPTPILPLTDVKQSVLDGISQMTAWNRGGTMSNVGMAWGLRLLSPEAPLGEGSAWGDPDWQKAVVLMTDGDNLLYKLTANAGVNKPDSTAHSDWSAYGRIDSTFAQSVFHSTDLNTVKTAINTKLTSICQDMKAKNILVYTIIFTSGIDAQTKAIYQACASDPTKYYYAPSQTDLKNAFQVIGNELSNLRITK